MRFMFKGLMYFVTCQAKSLRRDVKSEFPIYKFRTVVVRCAMEWCIPEAVAVSVNWFITTDTVQFRAVS